MSPHNPLFWGQINFGVNEFIYPCVSSLACAPCFARHLCHAKGVQFYFPSCTYPTIFYCTIFPVLEHCSLDTINQLSEVDCYVVSRHFAMSAKTNSIIVYNFWILIRISKDFYKLVSFYVVTFLVYCSV